MPLKLREKSVKMYEQINFKSELNSIPHKELVSFLSIQLKNNEQLQKEFIKKFNISIQQKFIQDYVNEAISYTRKNRRSISKGNYVYNVVQLNKAYIHPKISYLKTLVKQEQFLESVKIAIALHYVISYVVAHNGFREDLGSQTSADKYENKWSELEQLIVYCYKRLEEEEYYLLNRRYIFKLFKESYQELLKSPIFNFIRVREHAKLGWLTLHLREEDKQILNKETTF